METKTEVLLAKDYYVNYYGQMIDIKPSSNLLVLFISGSGYGDQSYWCSFTNTYKVYRVKQRTHGDKTELEEVGQLNGWNGTDGCGFKGVILEQEVGMTGVTCDNAFMHIFKRDK
jgi:hypothetical protein